MRNSTRLCLLLMASAPSLVAGPPTVGGPAVPSPATFPGLKRGPDGYWQVDFGLLASFNFNPPDSDLPPNAPHGKLPPVTEPETQPPKPAETVALTDGIPKKVRSLDGQRVSLTGFMLPIHLDHGLVTDFLLIRSRLTCCFGIPPAPNEWVVVAMSGTGVRQTMDVPLTLYGVLHVGAMYEDHAYSGLYRLECEKVVAP